MSHTRSRFDAGAEPAAAIDGLGGPASSMLLGMWTTAATFYGLDVRGLSEPRATRHAHRPQHGALRNPDARAGAGVAAATTSRSARAVAVDAAIRGMGRRGGTRPILAVRCRRHRSPGGRRNAAAHQSDARSAAVRDARRRTSPAHRADVRIARRCLCRDGGRNGPARSCWNRTSGSMPTLARALPGWLCRRRPRCSPRRRRRRGAERCVRRAGLSAPAAAAALRGGREDRRVSSRDRSIRSASGFPRCSSRVSADVRGIRRARARPTSSADSSRARTTAGCSRRMRFRHVRRRSGRSRRACATPIPTATLTGLPLVNRELADRFLPQFAKGLSIGTVIVVALVLLRVSQLATVAAVAGADGDRDRVGGRRAGAGGDRARSLRALRRGDARRHRRGLRRARRAPLPRAGRLRRQAVEELAPVILVAAAITLLGYGTLVTSSYPPLRSIGLVSAVSIVTLAAASLFVLPAILAWLGRGRAPE